MNRLLCSLVVAVGLGLFCGVSSAQDFPSRPVKLLVPFPPGGGSDGLARLVVKKLQDTWKQPVVIQNQPGAQGNVGTAAGAKAEPDGYTVTLVVQSAISFAPHIFTSVSYDVMKDFAAVSRGTEQEFILVSNNNLPIKNLDDVIALARSKQGALKIANAGAAPQYLVELLLRTRKVQAIQIPYNGAANATLAVMSGEVDLMIANPTNVVQLIKTEKVKGVAVIGKRRNPVLPDLPHALELGYPEVSDSPEWYGFVVPAATPADIVKKLNEGFVAALKDPEVSGMLSSLGTMASPSTPQEFDKQYKEDYLRWGKLLKEFGVQKQ